MRELEAKLAELQDRLRANSSNSSTAPSSDPFRAPKFKPKKPTGKPPGGQIGHAGHHRRLLPVDQVDHVVRHVPKACRHCHAPIPPTATASASASASADVRGRHQVAELPPRAVVVTEHQSCAGRCPRCGRETVEPIPASVRRHCTGARLSAALCYLSAFVHGSRRAVGDVGAVGDVAAAMLGCPVSLGTVSAREAEMADALDAPYQQVQAQVRAATAKNVDETGWRRAGRWLWVAATSRAALFRIDRGRNWHGLQDLLGDLVQGTISSDRHGTYDRLKLTRRAVCWAHLKRDFRRWVDRGGTTAWIGHAGLAITRAVCRLWHRFEGRKITRPRVQRMLRPLRRRMRRGCCDAACAAASPRPNTSAATSPRSRRRCGPSRARGRGRADQQPRRTHAAPRGHLA